MKIDFSHIKTKNSFDVIVSNPPYQSNFLYEKSEFAQDHHVANIFQLFQEIADIISVSNSMIYPGQRWIKRAGFGMKEFGLQQINDKSLDTVIFYEDSRNVFHRDIRVAGGLTIVYKNKNRKNNLWNLRSRGIITSLEYPGTLILSVDGKVNKIIEKIHQKYNNFIHTRIKPQRFFGFESQYIEKYPESFTLCDNGFTNKPDGDFIRIFANDKAGKMGRTKWFWIPRTLAKKNIDAIGKWKVIISTVNLTGNNGRTPNAQVIPPDAICGRARIVIGLFNTEQEAKNYLKYLNTPIIRTLIESTGNFQSTFGRNVPDFQDYTQEIFYLPIKELNHELSMNFDLSQDEIQICKNIEQNLVRFNNEKNF